MSEGAFHAAFQYHWAGPALYIAMVWCIFAWSGRTILGRPKWMVVSRTTIFTFWTLVGLLAAAQSVRVLQEWIPNS